MKTFHYEPFSFPLPENHRFPVRKYIQLSNYLLEQGILALNDLYIPEAASLEQLALVHSMEYIDKVQHGKLNEKEIRRLGLPWSPELVERAKRSVGSTIAACRSALAEGISASLGGGTHHAYPDHGEGFCIFNDAGVASRLLQAEGRVKQIVILDCDVHQGNGTAAIFQDDSSVYTFSIHGARNFPFHKETSDLDIALEDGAGDEKYLSAMEEGLSKIFSIHAQKPFDLAIYLAGADPYRSDRFGRMAMSKAGLARRDRIVLESCVQANLPVAVTMSGGYASEIGDIVEIHAQTIRIANKTMVSKNYR
jgi:acetoin utilization deacetylase AcuC-like enzyme